MTEFTVVDGERRYLIRIDHHEIVIDRVDTDTPSSMGRLTLEAASVLARLDVD